MARSIQNFPNVSPPSAEWPYGRIRDNTGSGNGTPVNELTCGDTYQFLARLLAQGGLIPNGLPENNVNGFQYMTALQNLINAAADAVVAGAPSNLNTLNEIAAAIGDNPNFATTVTNQIAAEASARASADSNLSLVKADKTQSAWQNITLANGWVSFAGKTPQYRIDQFGQIHLRGELSAQNSSSTLVTGSGALPVPSGISDPQFVGFVVPQSNLGDPFTAILINTNGQLAVRTSDYTTPMRYRLDGISYWSN